MIARQETEAVIELRYFTEKLVFRISGKYSEKLLAVDGEVGDDNCETIMRVHNTIAKSTDDCIIYCNLANKTRK